MATQNQKSAQTDVFRPLANFPPSVWGCSFASLSSTADLDFESYTKEVEALKETVKEMLTQSTTTIMENIEFINLLCRFGVSYQFENEIDEQLNQIFITLPNLLYQNDYDLYELALLFRVLRQHGYKMSCDVFYKFKESNGEFKKSIINDVKGLLSLYEAVFLSVHEEDILDEALVFTRYHLEILAEKCNPNLAKHIKNALHRPSHQGIERIEHRLYISFYEGEDSKNETLIKFAKLDFNRLQILYKKELAMLSRRWEEMNLPQQLPYARDRLVENYIWAISAHFEPRYSSSRLLVTMSANLIAAMDDTYDAFATLEELECFTTAFQRLDMSATDELPEYMKVLYKALLHFFHESEKTSEGMSYRLTFLKEAFKELARVYLREAQWFYGGDVPTLNEYVRNGIISSAYNPITAASLLGMGNEVGIKESEWLQKQPKILEAAMLICRLMDDIQSHEFEKKRGDCPSSVECYMNENDSSKEEAVEVIQKMCVNAWKDINEQRMKPNVVSGTLLKFYLNLSRVMDFLYKHHDGYTNPAYIKDDVESLFLEEFPM
ncbi:probable terpene synthase 6 [Mercurialis annua]|uniref:probable terpene synthase 6 n=1 Tax=Mercurialis annua TaxID=3986 RepID=UPI0021609165|nr:probable terpene synthase 6 [Mercurialis annua]